VQLLLVGGQGGIRAGENAHGQQARVDAAADRHGGHRDTRGHLHDRVQGIHAGEGLGFPRFRGHLSGVHRDECTGRDESLLKVERAQVANR